MNHSVFHTVEPHETLLYATLTDQNRLVLKHRHCQDHCTRQTIFQLRQTYVNQCGNVEAATEHASWRCSYESVDAIEKSRPEYIILFCTGSQRPRGAGKRKIVVLPRVLYLIEPR